MASRSCFVAWPCAGGFINFSYVVLFIPTVLRQGTLLDFDSNMERLNLVNPEEWIPLRLTASANHEYVYTDKHIIYVTTPALLKLIFRKQYHLSVKCDVILIWQMFDGKRWCKGIVDCLAALQKWINIKDNYVNEIKLIRKGFHNIFYGINLILVPNKQMKLGTWRICSFFYVIKT